MSKLLFSLFFLLAVTCGNVLAAPPVSLPEQAEVFIESPDQALSNLPKVISPSQKSSRGADSEIGTAGAAPQLWYLQIAWVTSSNYPGYPTYWEPINDNQPSTVADHGGAALRVITNELGYGSTPVAKMNGVLLPGTANYQTYPICLDAYGYYTTNCVAGQIVQGFQKWWKLDGYQGGTFRYQNTSSNYPWNTMMDSLYIK